MTMLLRITTVVWMMTTFAASGQSGTLQRGTVTVDGLERQYWVYLPVKYSSAKKWPLVLTFHGSGGTGRGTFRQFNFEPGADREGFLIVAPEGIDRGWNDGRIRTKDARSEDDVKFVKELLNQLQQRYSVDARRVFSTGISNGAIFSIYLAYKIPDRILAIASVCGSMPKNIEPEFRLPLPVSALFINGTSDPLVKYDGGPIVSKNAGKGEVISTGDLVSHWIQFNGCSGPPAEEDIPDIDTHDHCHASIRTYRRCTGSAEVTLVTVTGGGHTWPGGMQYAPRFMIGGVCRDFSAEELIWDFFKRQKERR
jgi:polyhydroxybutyrate depolymerase